MIKKTFVVGLFYFLSVFPTYATDFTVSQQIVVDDTIPPTIPAPVSAIAVAASQIDVSWGASTDNQTLSGYRLFRDGSHIATTTFLMYSDTGLSASTTYVYTVEAFDWVFNISTTSAAATATTPSIAVATTTSEKTQGSFTHVRLLDLTVSTELHQASIAWETNIYAQYILRWGRADEYDLGFVRNELFKRSHATIIPDLQPETTYIYELIAYNQQGKEYVLSRDKFTTKGSPDLTPPLNVTNLRSTTDGDDVYLFWDNPPDTDFQKVRIVRSNIFYPTDFADGYVVYQGTEERFSDSGALTSEEVQFYTVYSYDTSGNISSGTVLVVYKNKQEVSNDGSDQQQLSDVSIRFSDVKISQNGIYLSDDSENVRVATGIPVLVEVPMVLLPVYIQTIIVHIENAQGEVESYMMHRTIDEGVYEATIPSFVHDEAVRISFSLYDVASRFRYTFEGYMDIQDVFMTTAFVDGAVLVGVSGYILVLGLFSVLFPILLFVYLFVWRRKQD